jgi:hypothetical protein
LLNELDVSHEIDMRGCCKRILKNLKDTNVFKAAEAPQKSKIWQQERKFRVTGSRIYSLYTYGKNNWTKKCSDFFWPKPIRSKYIKHGITFENAAREAYIQDIGGEVREIDLVIYLFVIDIHGWDLLQMELHIFKNGVPTKLLEIKCPFKDCLYKYTLCFQILL